MNILPVALTPRRILLIGAGKVAAQKARAILDSDCTLTIVARAVADPWFERPSPRFSLTRAEFSSHHAEGFDVVINATGDAELSRQLWAMRKERGFWLNCVDQPDYCDFYFGATARDHDLCVSVSTGGAAPGYAQKIRDLIAAILPRKTAGFYADLRKNRKTPPPQTAGKMGKVALIGCGPGKAEHLTLQALRLLNTLDVALIDALIGPEIVALLPPRCKRIDVSKRKGFQKFSQDEINAMLLDHARQGLTVGRLKSGDPLVFGRLFEEAGFLLQQGIEMEVANGVSAALAACLSGGIPPTLRDHAASALIVSAHLRETRFNDDWVPLLKTSPACTVIVLMAWSFAARIRESALRHGVPSDTPAAFVARIDRPDEITVIGTLDQLEAMAARCSAPAVLILGPTVPRALDMPGAGKRIILSPFKSESP